MSKLITTIILFLCVGISFAQVDRNPFRSIGKETEVLTLSKGKYVEIHDNDSLQRIGSVIINMNTGTIYKLLDRDTLYSESTLDPTIISRWYSPDPLASQFPGQSPYSSMDNNPVLKIDPLGLAAEDWFENSKGEKKWIDSEEKYEIEIGSKGSHEVWENIGKQLTEETAGTGNEFALFKFYTNYESWMKESDFFMAGIDVANPAIVPPMIPQYYHPLQDQMAGTPSEDRITSNASYFVANESINSTNFSDAMMGALIGGEGPENFYFGPNHSVSRSMGVTRIVFDAVKQFQALNAGYSSGNGITALDWTHFSQSKGNAFFSTLGSWAQGGSTADTPANFIGGAAIKIIPLSISNSNMVKARVMIHNVTSVGSGNINNGQSYPRPIMESSAQPYTNISQTLELNVNIQL